MSPFASVAGRVATLRAASAFEIASVTTVLLLTNEIGVVLVRWHVFRQSVLTVRGMPSAS